MMERASSNVRPGLRTKNNLDETQVSQLPDRVSQQAWIKGPPVAAPEQAPIAPEQVHGVSMEPFKLASKCCFRIGFLAALFQAAEDVFTGLVEKLGC